MLHIFPAYPSLHLQVSGAIHTPCLHPLLHAGMHRSPCWFFSYPVQHFFSIRSLVTLEVSFTIFVFTRYAEHRGGTATHHFWYRSWYVTSRGAVTKSWYCSTSLHTFGPSSWSSTTTSSTCTAAVNELAHSINTLIPSVLTSSISRSGFIFTIWWFDSIELPAVGAQNTLTVSTGLCVDILRYCFKFNWRILLFTDI